MCVGMRDAQPAILREREQCHLGGVGKNSEATWVGAVPPWLCQPCREEKQSHCKHRNEEGTETGLQITAVSGQLSLPFPSLSSPWAESSCLCGGDLGAVQG